MLWGSYRFLIGSCSARIPVVAIAQANIDIQRGQPLALLVNVIVPLLLLIAIWIRQLLTFLKSREV
jgi:hypothetical protein